MRLLILALMFCGQAHADQYVHGYQKSNGTYVQGYHRSDADSSQLNNYSTKGNVNPYTGQSGTVNPNSDSSGYRQNGYGSSSGGYRSHKSYDE